MELMRIRIQLNETLALDSPSAGVRMLPFTGTAKSKLFTGKVLPGGVDTQVFPEADRGSLHARYMLEGKDFTGKPCKLFIDNRAMMQKGAETVTYPRIYTDSEALRYLETADLTGSLDFSDDGLTIVIHSQDTATRKHIALQRAGLTLRGVLERKTAKPCPLVLMLHGFGGDMGLDAGMYQAMSDQLTAAGLATLRIDFNGHGRSEGSFTAMTPYNEIEDAAAFLQYARELDWVTEIYVSGHSQGGVVGGMLAGYYPDVVKKLVLLAPAASLKTDAQQGHCMFADYDTEHIPASVDVDGRHNVGGLYFRMAKTLPIFEVTAQYQNPLLVVFGGQDNVVSYTYAKQYLKNRTQGEMLLYKTLDHGLGGEEHALMLNQVVDFLVK